MTRSRKAPLGLLLTLVVMLGAGAASAAEMSRDQASAELKQVPAYAVMADYYPKSFDQVLDLVVSGLNKGRRFNDIVGDIGSIMGGLMKQQLPKANVENTLAALNLTRAQAKAASANDPQLCLVLLGMAKGDKPIAISLPPALVTQELDLMAKVLLQTAKDPQPPAAALPNDKLKEIAMEAYDALPGDELRAAMRNIDGDPAKAVTPLSQTAYCEFSIAMFDVILKMRPIEAAQTYRALTAVQ